MTRNLLKSAFVVLPLSSAMLVGIDDAERRIFEIKPKVSSLGNCFVIATRQALIHGHFTQLLIFENLT